VDVCGWDEIYLKSRQKLQLVQVKLRILISLNQSPSILYRADNISDPSLHFEKSKE
jgi:hypothetical protein